MEQDEDFDNMPIDFLISYAEKYKEPSPHFNVMQNVSGLHYASLKMGHRHGDGYGATVEDARIAAAIRLIKLNSPRLVNSYLNYRIYRLMSVDLDPARYKGDELTRKPIYPNHKSYKPNLVDLAAGGDKQSGPGHGSESDPDDIPSTSAAAAKAAAAKAAGKDEESYYWYDTSTDYEQGSNASKMSTAPPSPTQEFEEMLMEQRVVVADAANTNWLAKLWKSFKIFNCFGRNVSE